MSRDGSMNKTLKSGKDQPITELDDSSKPIPMEGGVSPSSYKPLQTDRYEDIPIYYNFHCHEEYAARKLWMTEKGEEIPYEELEDSHLDNCIALIENTNTNRKPHYKGLIQERLRRDSKAGKVLYGASSGRKEV